MRRRVGIGLAASVLLAISYFLIAYLYNSPTDLRLESVSIGYKNPKRLAHDIGPRWQSASEIAVIDFSTESDLELVSNSFFFNGLFVEPFLCSLGNNSKGRISSGYSLVLDDVGPLGVGSRRTSGLRVANPGGGNWHYYHINISLRSDGWGDRNRYDLIEHPEDICFVLVRHLSLVGNWPRTNVVRVPRELIVKALAWRRRFVLTAPSATKRR